MDFYDPTVISRRQPLAEKGKIMTIVKTILQCTSDEEYETHVRRIRAAAKAVQDDVRSTPNCNPYWDAMYQDDFKDGKLPIENFKVDDFSGIIYICNPNNRTIKVNIRTVDYIVEDD